MKNDDNYPNKNNNEESDKINEKSDKIVVCVDFSGSTYGSFEYWRRVIEIIEENPNADYILWDHESKFIEKKELKEIAISRRGNGGTKPSKFIPLIKEYKNIIIITDGQVSDEEVENCDKLISEFKLKFNFVNVIFVKVGRGEINLSVSAPFTRNTSFIIENNGEIYEGDSDIEFDFIKYRNNPYLFLEDFEKLHKAVTMKSIGIKNLSLRNKILDLKNDLMNYLKSNNSNNMLNELRKSLNNNDYENSLRITKRIYESCFNDVIDDIDKAFNHLINACDLKSNFSMNLLQPTRIIRSKNLDDIDITEINTENISERYECPISCDNDSPCLLIKEGYPVLDGIEKKELEMIITNPLIVLTKDNIKKKIKERIDHIIGFKTYKTLFDQNRYINDDDNILSPYSRDKISCGIIFGHDKTHLNSFNFTLANIFFGKKLVGLPILWVYVLYKVTQEVEHIKDNESFFNEFKIYFIERLKKSYSNITLSGLPIHPLIQTNADIAVWYSVVSPFIIDYKDGNDDSKNRLRSFGYTSKYLIDIIDMLGYPYDRRKTLKLMSLYKAFSWMMNEEKKGGHSYVIENQWLKKIKSYYQGSIKLDDGYIVLIDGPVTEKHDLPDFRIFDDQDPLSIGELVYLSELVDISKTVNTIHIDIDKAENNNIPEYIVSYGYDYNNNIEWKIPEISHETLRPYSVDRENNVLWRKNAIEMNKAPLDRQISLFSRFIEYVKSYKEFPSKTDFIKFLERKERMRNDYPKITLPRLIKEYIDSFYDSYEAICGKDFCNIDVDIFIKKTRKSCSLIERFKMDGSKDKYESIYNEVMKESMIKNKITTPTQID